MSYTHFKMTWEDERDVAAVANRYFVDTQKAMVCLHPKSKKGAPPHWHFQGVLRAGFELSEIIKELGASHKARLLDPKCRPVKAKKDNADENGFQYMIRHGVDSCVYQHGFTDEDLEVLLSASSEHVESLQAEGLVYLKKNMSKVSTAVEQHKLAKHHIYKMYRQADKMWPPNAPKLVLYWLAKWCDHEGHLVNEMAEYISERYF